VGSVLVGQGRRAGDYGVTTSRRLAEEEVATKKKWTKCKHEGRRGTEREGGKEEENKYSADGNEVKAGRDQSHTCETLT